MLKNILLGLLDYGNMTGYELKQTIDNSTGHFWHAHHSQIYTTLRQMEKDGLVTSVFAQKDDALKRRVYTLTEQGKIELTNWLNTPMEDVQPLKEDFLVRIFFSGKRDPQKVLDELALQKRIHQITLNGYENLKKCMPYHDHPKASDMPDQQKYWNLTLEMGLLYEKMYLEWLDIAVQTVKPE
jgi:PadR family transcriptional regulator, regulatory protein AphA